MNKQIIAQRLKSLREGAKLSQAKLSYELNIKQPLIARYETAVNTPSYSALIAYADFFDVSCDYLLGRCDEPQGLQYNCIPKTLAKNPHIQEFLEMCFDPKSPANAKLREAIAELLVENEK